MYDGPHTHKQLHNRLYFLYYSLFFSSQQEQAASQGLGWFSSGTSKELAKKTDELQVAKTDLVSKIREIGTYDSCHLVQ